MYQVEDLVVVPKESVILTIEVKTNIDSDDLHSSIDKMIRTKSINKEIKTMLFIYNPPKNLSTIKDYFEQYNFFDKDNELLPDHIYGTGLTNIFKVEFTEEGLGEENYKQGYLAYTIKDTYFVVEDFYFDVYRKVENAINQNIEEGIDNIFHFEKNEEGDIKVKTSGRISFSSQILKDHDIICATSGILTRDQ